MTPVYQTKDGEKGNCFAACVASILDRKIEDCDIDMENITNVWQMVTQIQEKANCKIYYANREAIEDGFFKPTERFCFIEVCTCTYNKDPYDNKSRWHVVVGEVGENGKVSMLFDPGQDLRKSLDLFAAVRRVFFVKANSNA